MGILTGEYKWGDKTQKIFLLDVGGLNFLRQSVAKVPPFYESATFCFVCFICIIWVLSLETLFSGLRLCYAQPSMLSYRD